MRHTQINPGLGLSPQGGSMSSPRAGITMRPELARSGLFNTMMGKSLRKIGRDRHGKQHKKSAYMGKEEVWERNWLI
jgi:hypothetical protein